MKCCLAKIIISYQAWSPNRFFCTPPEECVSGPNTQPQRTSDDSLQPSLRVDRAGEWWLVGVSHNTCFGLFFFGAQTCFTRTGITINTPFNWRSLWGQCLTSVKASGVLWLLFEKTGSNLPPPHIYVRLAALLHSILIPSPFWPLI